jgi:hypothetical protein
MKDSVSQASEILQALMGAPTQEDRAVEMAQAENVLIAETARYFLGNILASAVNVPFHEAHMDAWYAAEGFVKELLRRTQAAQEAFEAKAKLTKN